MKRISRLTALLLAIMMLSSVAYATEEAIDIEDLNISNYSLMVAAAQDANEVIGKTALTNQDNVEVNSHHYNTGWFGSMVIDTLAQKGTSVTVTSVNNGILDGALDSHWYGVSYVVGDETRTGYIKTKYLDIQEPAPEITFAPWDGVSKTVTLTCAAADAASYEWQRGLTGENGEIVWEIIPDVNGAGLSVVASLDNLQYTYRCVAKDESGAEIAKSKGVTVIREDLASWLSDGDITAEMLARALNAPDLDSLVIEGEWLIHVRTGEEIAYYNTRTNALISSATGEVLGFVIDDMVYAPRR